MENNNNISAFDEAFKAQLQEHSIAAPAKVLAAVQASTAASAAAKTIVAKWVIGGFLAVSSAGAIFYALQPNETDSLLKPENEKAILQEDNKTLSESAELKTPIVEMPMAESAVKTVDKKEVSALNSLRTEEVKVASKTKEKEVLMPNTQVVYESKTENKVNNKELSKDLQIKPNKTNAPVSSGIYVSGDVCNQKEVKLYLKNKANAIWEINGIKQKETANGISLFMTSGNAYKISAYQEGYKVADTIFDFTQPILQVSQTELVDGVVQYQIEGNTDGKVFQWIHHNEVLSYNKSCVYNSIINAGSPILLAENASGCLDTVAYKIRNEEEFKILTEIITPNGDGKNDEYEIQIGNYSFFHISIADVSGKVVFTSNNPRNTWKGYNLFSNQACPNGKYSVKIVYQLVGSNNKNSIYEKVWLNK